MTRDKSTNTDFSFRPNEITSFTVYDSYDEDDESNTEMTAHVQDVIDTSYILSYELYESSTSATTESDNDKDENWKDTAVMILYLIARQQYFCLAFYHY